MNSTLKNLALASVSGLIIVAAAALAISPAMAAGFTPKGYDVAAKARSWTH